MLEYDPLVSVLMTAYNREKYIAEAIESVLNSTYKNFELIIVDDTSTDRTVAIAKEYAEKDSRIRFYVNEKNLGDYPNRNEASKYARGYFIMNVDSDDTIYPNAIENCVHAMLKFPEHNFGMYLPLKETRDPFYIDSTTAINSHLFKEPFLGIGPGGTILNREFFEKINKYPTKYGPANDMYFNLKACCNSGIIMLPFDIVYYRRHEGQEINNRFGYLYHSYTFFNDALLELDLPLSKKQIEWLSKKNKRRFVINIAKYFFKTFNVKKSIQAIKKAEFTFKDASIGIFHL